MAYPYYGNPYQNYSYQNSYPYQQPYLNYASTLTPQQSQQNINVQPQELLQGTIVDSIDVVRGKNCSLDGTPQVYPKSDFSEIYVKKLDVNTGAGMLLTYRLVQPQVEKQVNIDVDTFASTLSQFKSEIVSEILDGLTVPTSVQKQNVKKGV